MPSLKCTGAGEGCPFPEPGSPLSRSDHSQLCCAPCECGCAPSQLVKGGRRFIDWVIEVDTVRGWRCLRSFRDIDECRAHLVALPPGDNIEFLAP
jgi:hypothetical protein